MTAAAATTEVDVLVVGAGVVGAAIARELAVRDATVLIVDAGDDVGDGTSKANTAILHTGFDAYPGTLESGLVRRGHELLGAYAEACGIAVEHVGALLVAWDEEQLAALDGIEERARANGYEQTRRWTSDEVYAAEPHLGPGALGAVEVPGESIIDPWSVPLAFATEAVRLGVELRLRSRVTSIAPGPERTVVRFADHSEVHARWVVNAAGLGSDVVDRMLGFDRFTIVPRRGQLVVFDKFARSLVSRIILPVPTALGKGVLIAPTVFGNVMLGPTAEDLTDRTATGTTADGLDLLLAKGRALMPALVDEEVTASYAGLRAATEHADYQLHVHPDLRYVCVGGIRSTGLTASLAIAEHVREQLAEAGAAWPQVRDFAPPRMPPLGAAQVRPFEDDERTDPAYGQVVCFCEKVTAGEIAAAVGSDLPPATWDGLRRRTRAMNGRCQGFYCGAGIRATTRLAARDS